MDVIHNYLLDSTKQNNDMLKNTINATHPVVFVKKKCKQKPNGHIMY